MIEFSNTSLAKDTEDKPVVYAQAVIEKYWVMNLRDGQGPAQEGHRCVILYWKPAEGNYQSEQKIFAGDISSLLFPDVVVSISRLLT